MEVARGSGTVRFLIERDIEGEAGTTWELDEPMG
jgi:hypothetical protein